MKSKVFSPRLLLMLSALPRTSVLTNTGTLFPMACEEATDKASSERSAAVTAASGIWYARDQAMQPEQE